MVLAAETSEAVAGQAYHWARFTVPQSKFLAAVEAAALWRDANGLGKSIALAIAAHDACRGVGRFAPIIKRPPVKVIVCGVSWEQMVPLMEKIWEYAPKDEIDTRTNFEPGRGITGKPPRIVYTSGPGKGSVISFATYKQGSQRIAGAQVALVILDEPPPELFLGEALPRILRAGGRLRIGFTPTLESPPLDYLWKLIDENKTVTEYNFTLKEENLWLIGAPRPMKTQAELEVYEKGILGPEREMRTGRSRYPLVGDRWISSFEDRHIAEIIPAWPQPNLEWGIGIDYGTAPGKTVAVLMACFQPFGDPARVYYVDCYRVIEGQTSIDDDAAGILDMLRRNQLRYEDVHHWIGDRKVEARVQGVEKSNQDLRGAMAHIMHKSWGQMRHIPTPRKFEGSPHRAGEIINTLFANDSAWVRPHCKPLIDAFRLFNGSPRHETKDAFDACAYITSRMVKFGSAVVAKQGRALVRT